MPVKRSARLGFSNSNFAMGLGRMRSWFNVWFSSGSFDPKGMAFGFVFGFLVRLVPEVLAFSSPIGWDTIHYAVMMKNGVVWPNWGSFFTVSWLLYGLSVPLYGLSGIDPFVLLKVVAPALYGLNVAGVYWFARRLLRWDTKMSLVAVGLFAVQLAALRISWDLLRNTLGMGLLLFTLPLIERIGSKWEFLGFAVLSLLTVFAHEYAAVTWAVVFIGLLVGRLIKGRFDLSSARILLSGLPALAVFAFGMYLRFFPIKFAAPASNVLSTGEFSVGRFRFMVNYLAVNDAVYSYASYWSLFYEVVLLFAFLYLPYLFLVWKGYFRNDILNLWLGLLLLGSFGCLVWPFYALDFWSKWVFMLVYPFTFYAVYGLFGILRSSDVRCKLAIRYSKYISLIGLAVLFSLGCAYLTIPVLAKSDNMGVIPTDVSLHFASAPTVPYEDVDYVTQAMEWLALNMNNDSFVILHHALLPWGQLYLDKSHVMIHFLFDADEAVDLGLSHGFSTAFFVWWNPEIEWYHVSIPSDFVSVERFGRISIFECVPSE